MALSRARARLLARLRERRGREREGLFLLEGVRSAREALAARAPVRFAVLSPRLDQLGGGPELREALARAGVEAVELTDAELAPLADTEAPQGVLLVCAEPDAAPAELAAGPVLALDGIQDPGNVGTLVRAAAAFGVGQVVMLDGTADPYGPKAVRAAAGGLFAVRIRRGPWDELGPLLGSRGPLLVGDMGGTDAATLRPQPSWTLVVGAEGAGVRPAVRAAATERVSIPMPGAAESLNAGVAGSILLYVLTRAGARG